MEMEVGEPLQIFQERISPLKSRFRGNQKQGWVQKLSPRGAKKANARNRSPPLPSAPVSSPTPVSVSAQPQKAPKPARDPKPASCRCCSSFTCADCRRTWLRSREQARDLPVLSGCSLFSEGSLPGRRRLPGVSDKASPRTRRSALSFAATASPPSAPSFCVAPTLSFSTSFLSSLVSSWSKQNRSSSGPRQYERTVRAGGASAQLPRVEPGPRSSQPQPPPPPPPLPPSSLLRPARVPGRLVPVTIHFPEDCSLNSWSGLRGTKFHVHL